MTCRALLHARHIAETCNGLECAEPEPVDATRLREARERMATGASVAYLPALYKHTTGEQIACELWVVYDANSELRDWAYTPAEATRAYLRLCESLTESAPATFPVATHDGRAATAGVGPASTSASFSPSAPLVSPGPGAVAGEVPPIANASPASDSGAR